MRCELCEESTPDVFVILPIKKPDGCLNTIACLECAENSSCYCQKHERPHLGFADDDTTACVVCIEEMVRARRTEERFIAEAIFEELPKEEARRLIKWADLSGSITGDTKDACILRAIATKALRINQSIEEVVEKIISEESIDFILPSLGYS